MVQILWGVPLGLGNGTFKEVMLTLITADSQPFSIVVGDFDEDNQLDIVVANSGANNIGILFGQSYIAFADQNMYSTGSTLQPYLVFVDDLDHDNWLDIAIVNAVTGNIGVFFGSGDGNFSTENTYATGFGSHPQYLAAVDFNKDHRLDIVVSNYGTNNLGVILGYGNDSFKNRVAKPPDLARRILVFRLFSWLKNLLKPTAGF